MEPIIKVTVNGQPLSEEFFSRLVSLEVSDKEGVRSDTCAIQINDSEPFIEIPRRGAPIGVAIGYDKAESLGDFIVDTVQIDCLPYGLHIGGKAADMRDELKAQKNRHFDKKSVKDIVSEVAKDHGLEPVIADSVGSHVYEWIGQIDESDLNFVERLAKRQGALFTIKEGKLIFAEKGAGQSVSGKSLGGLVITPDMIVIGTCKAEISDRESFGKVAAYFQDSENVQRVEEIFENPLSNSAAIYRLRQSFSSKEEAKKAAEAKSVELNSQALTVQVSIVGDPRFRAGCVFIFQGVRPGLDGIPFVIEEARHTYDKNDGYRVHIRAKVQKGKNESSGDGTGNGTVREAKDKTGADGTVGTGGTDWSLGWGDNQGDGPE